MMCRRSVNAAMLVTMLVHPALMADEQQLQEISQQAIGAFRSGDREKAIILATEVIQLAPENPQSYQLRGTIYDSVGHYAEAIRDFDTVLKLDSSVAQALNQRGAVHFKLGEIAKSIEDFDAYLEMRPEEEPKHWMRGISCYYAGRYEEGAKQFEGYQSVDDNDVENAVWRFLCMARGQGIDEARASILKIGLDRRIPMMKIYDLFRGEATAEEVLAEARAGDPSEVGLKHRLFYAHLYIGLYHEATNDSTQARQHIVTAADKYPIGHYMWHVARVHKDRLDQAAREKVKSTERKDG